MNFTKSRFHIDYGPASLFERVRYIMASCEEIKLHSKHFKERTLEREIPIEVINSLTRFSVDHWELIMAEVRNDTGKFVSSTWQLTYDGIEYVVVIGLHNAAQTVFSKDNNPSLMKLIVKSGPQYDFVERVNRELMIVASAQMDSD